jgi:hypothetical protein
MICFVQDVPELILLYLLNLISVQSVRLADGMDQICIKTPNPKCRLS